MTHPVQNLPQSPNETQTCSQCFKSAELCLCTQIKPFDNQVQILILQHPQEPDKELGSARLAHLTLKNSTLKVGLSWPNLSKALGKPVQPSKWAVLYLGSGIHGQSTLTSGLQYVSKKGVPQSKPSEIEGIVVLDGTWSQAKALWWRNPWLLKLNRAILIPSRPSLYRNLRKEPRRECLSTLESISEALKASGESEAISETLLSLFSELLKKYQASRPLVRKPS